MFEKYTEKARRVIFFARYEASQLGSSRIETEHVLLGLLREDKALTSRFFTYAESALEKVRKQVESRTSIRDFLRLFSRLTAYLYTCDDVEAIEQQCSG